MKISQREARRLRKRVETLEGILKGQRNAFLREFPTGLALGKFEMTRDWLSGRIEAARRLGHAVVVTEEGNGHLNFYALPHARMPI